MSRNGSARPESARGVPSGAVSVAVMAALATLPAAAQQASPVQASQRSQYGSGLGQSELPKGGRFEWRVDSALQYAANVNLAEDGQPQIDMAGLQLAPGFYASYSTGVAVGAIDYSLIGKAWEDSDFNDVSHSLDANGQVMVVPEWFTVGAQASYSDSVIDPLNGLNYGGLGIFGPSNLVEVATASVNPALQHTFNFVELTARYNYGRTWYLDEGKGQPVTGFVTNQDSTDQSAYFGLGTADRGGRLSATVFYDWQKSEYDTALPYKYERAGLDAGLQIARTLTVVGDIGRQSDLDASTTQGGLDSEFWSAGLRWEPNENTSAEGRYGKQFFGDSWSLSATHRARFAEFSASYSEQPTVETRTLSLGGFNPGTLPPGTPGFDFGRFNSSPYVSRSGNVGVQAVGSRTTLGLNAFYSERDYIRASRSDETGMGAAFNASRQLASNLTAGLQLSYSDYERSFDLSVPGATASDVRDLQGTINLSRKSGERLTLSAETGYLTRTGDAEYDGWWVGLRARWTP